MYRIAPSEKQKKKNRVLVNDEKTDRCDPNAGERQSETCY